MPIPTISDLQGSVFFNGSSYSGADIRVVVHIYDKGEAVKAKLQQLDEEARKLDVDISNTLGEIQELQGKLDGKSVGTPSYDRYSTQLRKRQNLAALLQDISSSISTDITRLRTGQPTTSTKVLAEVQTISISSSREKHPVRALGGVYPKGFVRGQRTIAGSLIFTVFHEHVLYEFLEAGSNDFDGHTISSALLDQLPPVDISVLFANEYGSLSKMSVLGVEFVNEGQVMSIEDILTENVVNYVARDFDPMRSVAQRKYDENSRLVNNWQGVRGSDLIQEDEYQNTKSELDPFFRYVLRSNNFI